MEKENIIQTRTGGLGSSDAKMVAKIGRNGCIGESDKKRIAIMLGLEEQKQFSTTSTEYGNYIENCIFEFLKSGYKNAVSNPYTKSEKLSKKYGFGIFNHIDFEVESNTCLSWFECKAVNHDSDQTMHDYFEQFQWHYYLGLEKAKSLNKSFSLNLVHYQTEDKDSEFDSSRIKIVPFLNCPHLDIFVQGFEIISESIKDFHYEKSDEFQVSDLPLVWQNECEQIRQILIRQKEEEQKVENFKEQLKEIMQQNNIKSIKNDFFGVIFVAETVSTKLDSKKLKSEMPEVFEKYSKQSKVKSSIRLTIK